MSRFNRAYAAGQDAARSGLPRESCPYRDGLLPNGKATFTRAWRKAWMAGWFDAFEEGRGGIEHETGLFD